MFRTELTIVPQERQLPRTARVLTVGSCFAESIGNRLRLHKVQAQVNPFGTVFQPLALAKLLRASAGEEQDWQQHVVEARGRWQSYDFHSTLGAESPVELLQTIQDTVRRVSDFLRTTDAVVVTLGTAWAYRLRETDELVSNLHKLPASLFEKELLTADEIVNALAEVHALLRRINPGIRIILTVSPVRHLKDTLPLNAVGKSVLRVACHYLSELLPDVSYFPAYELLTDDLRDYRFYAADMLHPSEVAEEYIWDRFTRVYFDAEFGRFRKEWAAVRQALGHRPLHAGAPEHRIFLDQTYERLTRLASQDVDVRQELRDVQRQLAALPPPKPARALDITPGDDEERIDIGEETETNLLAAPQLERSPDTRRNNHRTERPNRDRRNTSPIPLEVILPEPIFEELIAAVEGVLPLPDSELPTEENTTYPAKKKKRRSRGGAKRTARKHAARLATEQQTIQPTFTNLASDTEIGLDLGELSFESVADKNVATSPTDALEITEASKLPSPAEIAADTVETPSALATTRKRGTGPTPKKSKVITKSGLVKRGKRSSLYRSSASITDEIAAESDSESATAPIISPPIIPEVLLERPAVALATLPEEAVSEAQVTPAASTPSRRGRPKTATQPAVTASPTATTTVLDESLASVAIPSTSATSPAEPATRPKKAKATSSQNSRKVDAKPTASRRGRPPGKKMPPSAAETPAA